MDSSVPQNCSMNHLNAMSDAVIHTKFSTDFLSDLSLGPRECEDCGELFTVPPYMDCAKWKHCKSCLIKRFQDWLATHEAKETIEMFESRNFTNDKP